MTSTSDHPTLPGPLTRKQIKQCTTPNRTDRTAIITPNFGPPIRHPRPALTTQNTGNLYTRRATPKPEFKRKPVSGSWSPPTSWAVAADQQTFRETEHTRPQHYSQSYNSTSTWATTASSGSPSGEIEWKALEASGKISEVLHYGQVLPDTKSGEGEGDVELGVRRRIEGEEYVDWIAEQRGKEERAKQKQAQRSSWKYRRQIVAALGASVFLVIVLLVVVGVLAAS